MTALREQPARRADCTRASIVRRLIEREGQAQGLLGSEQASGARPAGAGDAGGQRNAAEK